MLILISDAFDDALPKKLSRFGEVTDDPQRLPEAEVVLVRSKTKCTKDWIDRAANLKLIIRGGVGMDNIDRAYAAGKNIKAVNTAAASAIAVAELAFSLMLAVPNRLLEAHQSMSRGEWLKKELKRTELFGKTLGLLGLGNIAGEVAKRAAAFGMTVLALRQSGAPSELAEVVTDPADFYPRLDYLSIHVPLTDRTRRMIDEQVLGMMKKGVVIVNTGRADVLDPAALKTALAGGKVAAYATDVWPSDPPAVDYPLLTAPNVLMTPHIGASTKENLGRIGNVAAELIERYVNGKLE